MPNSYQGPSQWQPGENQYFIKDEPDYFSSQDSGICLRSEPDNSLSEEYDVSSISVDSGYYTSFNNSHHDDSTIKVDLIPEKTCEMTYHPSLAPLCETASQRNRKNRELLRIEKTSRPVKSSNANTGGGTLSGNTIRQVGLYGHTPVRIQPKPVPMQNVQQDVMHQAVVSQEVKRRPTRSRKSPLIPKVDEYHPKEIKPSQELLAARRLLEEALIIGNIVSQARYARFSRKLDKMRMQIAQRSSIIESFSHERLVTVESQEKRARYDEKAKCSRALYQENKRLRTAKFTWKIGIHGPHKSFNKISVKKSGKKKRRHLNRQPLMYISDDSDENII